MSLKQKLEETNQYTAQCVHIEYTSRFRDCKSIKEYGRVNVPRILTEYGMTVHGPQRYYTNKKKLLVETSIRGKYSF